MKHSPHYHEEIGYLQYGHSFRIIMDGLANTMQLLYNTKWKNYSYLLEIKVPILNCLKLFPINFGEHNRLLNLDRKIDPT